MIVEPPQPVPKVNPDFVRDEEEVDDEEEKSDDDFVPDQQVGKNTGVAFTILESSPSKRKATTTRASTTPQKKRNSTQQSPAPRTPTPRKYSTPRTATMSSGGGKQRPRGLEARTNMHVDELTTLFNGACLHKEQYPEIIPAGVGLPFLVGRWTEETENDDFTMTEESYILFRWLPHAMLTAGMISLAWTDDTTLELVIRWPTFFSVMRNHVGLQDDGAEEKFKFEKDGKAFKSVHKYLRKRAERSDGSKPFFFDKWVFVFHNKMDTSVRISEMLQVTLRTEDIDVANKEKMPAGNVINVHQIILQEAQKEDGKIKTFVTAERKTGLGLYLLLFLLCNVITYNPLDHLLISSVCITLPPFVKQVRPLNLKVLELVLIIVMLLCLPLLLLSVLLLLAPKPKIRILMSPHRILMPHP